MKTYIDEICGAEPLPADEYIENATLHHVNSDIFRRFRAQCMRLDKTSAEGFEEAISAWLLTSPGADLLSQPPFSRLPPKIQNEFRARCAQKGCSIPDGMLDAMVVWIRNFSFTDPPPDAGKPDKKR